MVVRTVVLGLALSFIAAQAVSWADCCCGSLCRTKNACAGCPPGESCPGRDQATTKPTCCDQEESAPRKTCSHLEPSSEIDTVSGEVVATAPSTELLSPIESLPDPGSPLVVLPVDTGPPRAGPSQHLPLHLYLSILRI